MPLQATSGAASYDAFGGGVPVVPAYIEEVFSTYLYTGTGASSTVTNGVDLSTKGGIVWFKNRTTNTDESSNQVFDAAQYALYTNSTTAATYSPQVSFLTTGFSLTSDGNVSKNGVNFVSWTFRKQPKFFDVVTYTGTGVARTVAHNLGSVPGCIIVKRTNAVGEWPVYHRSLGNTDRVFLDLTNATGAASQFWNDTTPTATEFTVGTGDLVNQVGDTYVAYIFAHDAGGFGLTGTDNVISCGSFTTDGSAKAVVNLGYEPQWILHKRDEAGEDWRIADNMRGWQSGGTFQRLEPNTSDVEANTPSNLGPTATGFETFGNAGASKTFIYIAIRRGPMKVPTSGTSVFSPLAATLVSDDIRSISLVPDAMLYKWRTGVGNFSIEDRLRGFAKTNSNSAIVLATNSTAAEATEFPIAANIQNTTWIDGAALNGVPSIIYNLKRAPSFFDEVCYTGTGVDLTVNHNLGVAPELIIFKSRNTVINWRVAYGFTSSTFGSLILNLNSAGPSGVSYNTTISAQPTATTFSVGSSTNVGASGGTYVAYLFATCPGVSKVGSYTGNGTTQTINCGFTGGARFVLVKATSTTGNWIVADSARGIVAGNDPALYLNSTAAEVTGLDWIDADNSGFVVNQTAIAANTNGVSYIFLAIA